ncbi:hypothetical protein KFE25_012133 [Diacronema lutheri]|uniref:Palmitoyltransferase n=1 Tax=Diacronema lutheri TaxID=2081491 RepID=A0A8J5XEC4_DIALT|nr:hypothetical protein KFE25_012133 [Diacronema lutheri]
MAGGEPAGLAAGRPVPTNVPTGDALLTEPLTQSASHAAAPGESSLATRAALERVGPAAGVAPSGAGAGVAQDGTQRAGAPIAEASVAFEPASEPSAAPGAEAEAEPEPSAEFVPMSAISSDDDYDEARRAARRGEADLLPRSPQLAPELATDAGARSPSYKTWPGKNRFYCGGRVMTGPKEDDHLKMGTWAAMLLPVALFMGAAGADLLLELRPLFYALCVLVFLDISLLVATSYSDPGIIPRQPHARPEKGNHFRSYDVGGTRVTELWCTTCSLYRPPGCSHCRDCDNCVRDWDHHCPFVGNCIGRRNYGYFYCYLVSISASAATMSWACVVVSTGPEWERHFSPTRIATMAVAAILLFALAVSLVIGCFTVFHASLILANVTTKEWCKKKERSALRDDNRVHRVFYACCEPSEVTFTELVPKNLVGNYAELL